LAKDDHYANVRNIGIAVGGSIVRSRKGETEFGISIRLANPEITIRRPAGQGKPGEDGKSREDRSEHLREWNHFAQGNHKMLGKIRSTAKPSPRTRRCIVEVQVEKREA